MPSGRSGRPTTRWTGSASRTSLATTAPVSEAPASASGERDVAEPGLGEAGLERREPRGLDLDGAVADRGQHRRAQVAQPAEEPRDQRPGSRPGLGDRERVRPPERLPRLLQQPADDRAVDRVRLGRGQEVAAATGAGVRPPVVAVSRLVERPVHEPGEGDRAVCADLVADRLDELGVLAHRLGVGEGLAAIARLEVHVRRRRRGRARAAPRGRRACARPGGRGPVPRPRTPSARGATGRRSSRGAGGRSRTGPRAPASRARPRRAATRGGRGCRRAPRPRTAPRCVPRASGPSRSRRSPSRLRGDRRFGLPRDAASDAVRSPRSSMSARVRALVPRSRRARSAAPMRPATSSSADGSAARARSAASRARTAVEASAPGTGMPVTASSSSSRSSGESTSTARSRRARRSRTSMPATSASQRGSALSPSRFAGRFSSAVPAHAIAIASAEWKLFASAPGVSAAAASTNARRSSGVARGIDPAPRTTRPAGSSSRTSRMSRVPNGVSSAGSRRTTAAAAPASRNATRCRSASAVRASSRTDASGPAPASGAGARMRTVTGAGVTPGV